MEVFSTLSQSSDTTTAILAGLNIILFGVIVVQWKYIISKSVPKWVWEKLVSELKDVINNQHKILEKLAKMEK